VPVTVQENNCTQKENSRQLFLITFNLISNQSKSHPFGFPGCIQIGNELIFKVLQLILKIYHPDIENKELSLIQDITPIYLYKNCTKLLIEVIFICRFESIAQTEKIDSLQKIPLRK